MQCTTMATTTKDCKGYTKKLDLEPDNAYQRFRVKNLKAVKRQWKEISCIVE